MTTIATPTEFETARAIARGRLPSPQRVENSALFDMRVTGTGLAFRNGLNEYVWRDPSIYLNDEFLARCNGLPVVWEHPGSGVLDSSEFARRVIGAVVYPYLKGAEVWAVARIFDRDAIRALAEGGMSTSPAVVFHDPKTNSSTTLDDGRKLLIEGEPSLIDHLAICEEGVWDKGRAPDGVRVDAR